MKKDRKLNEILSIIEQKQKACATVNKDCYLCQQFYPEIYSLCPEITKIQSKFMKIILGDEKNGN